MAVTRCHNRKDTQILMTRQYMSLVGGILTKQRLCGHVVCVWSGFNFLICNWHLGVLLCAGHGVL